MAAHDDERGGVVHRHGRADARFQGIEVVGGLPQVHHMPAVGREPLGGVVGQRQIGGAVDGDPIVVVDADQPVQALVPGQR